MGHRLTRATPASRRMRRAWGRLCPVRRPMGWPEDAIGLPTIQSVYNSDLGKRMSAGCAASQVSGARLRRCGVIHAHNNSAVPGQCTSWRNRHKQTQQKGKGIVTTSVIALEQGTGCHVVPVVKTANRDQLARARVALLLVRGMGCPTCALRVRNGLLQMDGVVAADVALSSALAKVWYDPGVVQPDVFASGLPASTEDGRHHYSAQVLEVFDPSFGGTDEILE